MGKSINVCMISTNHSPFDSRIFYKEAKSLLRAGFAVTVIGKNNPEMEVISEGINVIGIRRGSGAISYFKILKMLLKRARDVDADIYHCHEPESLPILIYLKLTKSKKVVYDVHEYYPEVVSLSDFNTRLFLRFMLYIFEPIFYGCVDAIITATEQIEDRYKKFNHNVYTIFNFPTLDFESSSNLDLKNNYQNKSLVIYVGGMYKERGIIELIKAVHMVAGIRPSIKLLLLGTFASEEFEKECKEYVNINNLAENVEFLGFVPHENVADYIKISDIGAVLLKPILKFFNSIPIKQFEYMICGIPIIGSRLPPIENVVGKEGAGILVDPNNIDEISNTIIYLLDHPEVRDEMGRKGRHAIEREYNWDRMEEILVRIYSEMKNNLLYDNAPQK